jgi:hypothetical protein
VLLACAVLWAGTAAAIAPSVTTAAVTLTPGHVPPPSATPPGTVRLGIYLYSVQDLDFAKHSFHATFEIWWRWRGEGFDPLAAFQIVGARSATATLEDRRKLPDGENYVVARVDAVINEVLDTGGFPFDRHRLLIEIESPYEDEYLSFAVDSEASLLDPEAFSPGWRLTDFRVHEERVKYPTTFGLKERANERYSRVIVEVVAARVGWRVALDYFIGFLVCALLCMLGYLLHPQQLGVRASIVTTATFTAVGNKYIVNTLTETSVTARLANVAVVTSFTMVLLLMITSIVCERMIEAGQLQRAVRLNRNVGAAATIGYVAVIAFFLWRAVAGAPT